jgi:hypothetical protein
MQSSIIWFIPPYTIYIIPDPFCSILGIYGANESTLVLAALGTECGGYDLI